MNRDDKILNTLKILKRIARDRYNEELDWEGLLEFFKYQKNEMVLEEVRDATKKWDMKDLDVAITMLEHLADGQTDRVDSNTVLN